MNHQTRVLGLLAVCALLFAGCGSSGSGGTEIASVNTLDSATGVAVNATFRYTASPPFDVSTVTTSSYFIVPTPAATANISSAKAAYDETVCDVSNALGATASCPMNWQCDLTPSSTLSYETAYTICLTDGITYGNGSAFAGFMASFTTADSSSAVTATLSPVTGATSVALDAAVTAVFSAAITEPADWSSLFTLQLDAAGDSLCTSVTYDSTTLTATCAHADFTRSSAYTATVSGVTDPTGAAVTTASAAFSTAPTVTLLRLDGTVLALTDRPIPRSATIKFALGTALTAEADRTAFEAAVTITDADAAAVAGTYAWAADYLSTVFTPTSKLGYSIEYTIAIDPSTMPVVLDLTKAVGTEMTFTTMTRRDINGDGYADSIVGAQGVAGGNANGAAYVFLGSATGIADCDLKAGDTPATTITGEANGDRFGTFAVHIAGGEDGDGYEDIIVGAPSSYGSGKIGWAYVFLGSATGIADCDLSAPGACTSLNATITGETADGSLGSSVSTAGDVNGDGFDDVIVGARYVNSITGAAYIFLGSAGGIADCDLATCTADTTIQGETGGGYPGGDAFGTVSAAGDVNADGYNDVIVGAGQPGDAGPGYVALFLGSENGISDCDLATCTPDARITGEADPTGSLEYTSEAGDVNGDGYADILIADGFVDLGKAYLFLGSENGISDCDLGEGCTADTTLAGGPGINKFFGFGSISGAGDTNADGYDDIIVGDFDAGDPTRKEGRAYVFLGSATGIADCTIGGTCTSLNATLVGVTCAGADCAEFGSSVSTTGDVNGDGYADIGVSDTYYPDAAKNGQSYVLLGSANGILDCTIDAACPALNATITGEENGDYLGTFK